MPRFVLKGSPIRTRHLTHHKSQRTGMIHLIKTKTSLTKQYPAFQNSKNNTSFQNKPKLLLTSSIQFILDSALQELRLPSLVDPKSAYLVPGRNPLSSSIRSVHFVPFWTPSLGQN